MGRIVAISNQKGGVGKTTTTGGLAAALKRRGQRVLAIDLDPQGNLSFSMAGEDEGVPTIYEVLRGEVPAQLAVQHTATSHLIPANILLSSAELEFTGQGREFLLRDALRPIRDEYDFILVDTPPALSVLTVNAFTAADRLIIPMLCDIFSLQGITQLYETASFVKTYSNPALEFAGLVLTRFAPRTTLATEVKGTAEMISSELEIPLFHTCIRHSVTITESQALQKNIFDYAPRNAAAKDFLALADEFLYKENGPDARQA